MEAFACGTKVVSSNKGGLPEIVSGVDTIVSPKDIDQITNTMKEISFQKQLRTEQEQKRLLRANQYSWKLAADAILDLIS